MTDWCMPTGWRILRNRACVVAASLLILGATVFGQEPLAQDRGAAGLFQSLKRLETTVRVMQITAHPDDEDGGTLTWLSRGRGVEVTLASITRGESGANLVTGDFFDWLGALRTLELRRAAQHYGAHIRFTRFTDFGYSKTLEETLGNWDRDEVVRDLVRIIRTEKPHVILSRFRGSTRDGHGHHQAAGLLAREAAAAAGDAGRFPEMAQQGLEPWKPLKFYVNNYRENEDWTVAVDAGKYDPVLGETYAQMARRGLRYQRSQGAGSAIAAPGPALRHYKLIASEVGMAEKETDFLDRIPAEKISIDAYPELADPIREARRLYSPGDPSQSAPALAKALAAVRGLRRGDDSNDLVIKERQILTALEQALGITFEVLVEPEDPPEGRFSSFMPYRTLSVAVPGQVFHVKTDFYAAEGAGVKLDGIKIVAPDGWEVERVEENRFRITVPKNAAPTRAHWSRSSVWNPAYRILDDELFGQPLPPPPLKAQAEYLIAGIKAATEETAVTSFVDSTGVQRRRNLVVGPAISVSMPTEAGVLPAGRQEYSLTTQVRNNAARVIEGTLRLNLPAGWKSEPASAVFAFQREGEQQETSFRVLAPGNLAPQDYPVEAVAVYEDTESRSSFERISYPGLEAAYLSHPARHTVRVVDVEVVPNLRIGYATGTGDDVPAAIQQLGGELEFLDTAALASGDLAGYDAILLGIRAYAAREDVKIHNQRLLDYVEQGGVLVVQYNTPEFDNNFGPYPYKMTRRPEEVSEQDSPVEILDPSDPVFTTPNKITLADFDGWVEQRGSKFMVEWDERYKPLLSTHDTGQDPQPGGWLVAHHGKGLYVYCAYAWYRQLPYAVPGAVRIFANLISLGAKDAAWRQE
jgi:LmbE family N-acetylglucosaminyl deacetylase